MTFQIGATEIGMVTLASLSIHNPQNNPAYFSQSANKGNNLVAGLGFPTDVWSWAGMTITQRNVLKGYVTNKSEEVFIQTMTSDQAYVGYRAIMIWPETETQQSTFVFDLSIRFRLLEVL